MCPLICENGYNMVNGCPTCSCSPYPICKCGPKPHYQVLCPDKRNNAGYTNICTRLPNGKCGWLFKNCPIIITISVSSKVTVNVIKSTLNLIDIPSDPSIQIILLHSTVRNMISYQITIPAELLPNINFTSTVIVKSISRALTLHGDVTVTLIQSHDAVVEDSNLFLNSTQGQSNNGNGRIIVFIGILVYFLLM
jgi:hypothetical protein